MNSALSQLVKLVLNLWQSTSSKLIPAKIIPAQLLWMENKSGIIFTSSNLDTHFFGLSNKNTEEINKHYTLIGEV